MRVTPTLEFWVLPGQEIQDGTGIQLVGVIEGKIVADVDSNLVRW